MNVTGIDSMRFEVVDTTSFWSAFWHQLVPPPQHCPPLTLDTIPYAFGYFVPFLFLGYLARRRDTHLLRLSLFPVIVVVTLHGTYAYGGPTENYAFYMCFRGFCGLMVMATSADLAFTKEGRLKIGESALPVIGRQPPSSSDSSRTSPSPTIHTITDRFLPAWLADALEVCVVLRGLGWKVGRDVYVPREHRPLHRDAFLRATASCFVKNFLVLDLCIAIFKLLPGIGAPSGGSIYYSHLPPFHRTIIALLIAILSGFTLISGIHVWNSLATIVGVGLLGQSPAQWPPIIDNPWAADSLHDFWSKRWHQTLRRTFVVIGGIPGHWVAGRPGFILGTFLASGLFHEGGTYLLGKGVDHRVTLFFGLQGVGVLMEKIYKSVTGYRMGGTVGKLWTAFFLLVLGQIAMDSWFQRGLAGGTILPASTSPAVLFVIPLVRRVVG